MPLRIPNQLPAIEALKKENIFVMDEARAHSQEIRPLKIVILNLMPLKITTETDLIRLLSNTPLQIEVNFMRLRSHTPKNTPIEHMMMFYKDFEVLKKQKWDGMIVTGAPIELLPFEEVEYWDEIEEIFDWARTNVTSTPDSIISTTSPNTRCLRSSSACSSRDRSIRCCPSSAASTTAFSCPTAATPKSGKRTS